MSSLGRDFRWLWAGNAAGNMADGVAFVAIPLVATTITTNPTAIAGLALVYSAVRILLVVPVGVVVDRVDRRLLMWLPNVLRGLILLALSLSFAAGVESLLLLYVAFALVGMMEIAADNAAISVLPDLVGPDDLDRANGRIATAQLVADEFVGPPFGGFLFALAVAAPLAATGGLYAAAGLLFLAIPRQPRPAAAEEAAAERPSMWRDAAAGATWIRGQQLLLGLAVTGGLASVAYMMTFSIIVLYATDTLGVTPAGYGLILAVSSLGGLLASTSTARMRQALGYRLLVPGALALGAITMLGLYVTTSPYVAALLLAAYIFHVTVWNICVVSLRQRLVPDAMRGRQNSLFKLSGLLGLVVGAAIAGPIASASGLATPFGIAGLVFVGCAAYTAWLLRTEPGTGEPSSSRRPTSASVRADQRARRMPSDLGAVSTKPIDS
ncbi:MFS transporter [Nocardioides sp. J2M5]|uniref:MFS transporter n=1 Tax=Nocardioides palaemonis TaxID=2829810 RepID=UPI001BAAA17F|nr:MFS transporter [Nocardioides palaemonis]MBS2937242.1 MFS transporter [Nocardioides palaemonis]